jgi:hypothetical protein
MGMPECGMSFCALFTAFSVGARMEVVANDTSFSDISLFCMSVPPTVIYRASMPSTQLWRSPARTRDRHVVAVVSGMWVLPPTPSETNLLVSRVCPLVYTMVCLCVVGSGAAGSGSVHCDGVCVDNAGQGRHRIRSGAGVPLLCLCASYVTRCACRREHHMRMHLAWVVDLRFWIELWVC